MLGEAQSRPESGPELGGAGAAKERRGQSELPLKRPREGLVTGEAVSQGDFEDGLAPGQQRERGRVEPAAARIGGRRFTQRLPGGPEDPAGGKSACPRSLWNPLRLIADPERGSQAALERRGRSRMYEAAQHDCRLGRIQPACLDDSCQKPPWSRRMLSGRREIFLRPGIQVTFYGSE